ncbi:MAG: filamentous hemagglutinin N-terminal domain-containing protein, partial [Betaproteobacteria bacterium]|nr:filamentous hemagglutinin N-terminal domain-containing protein [Betaproteobacteria bacterium]
MTRMAPKKSADCGCRSTCRSEFDHTMLKRLLQRTLSRASAFALAAVASVSLQSVQAQTAPANNALPTAPQVVAGSAAVSQSGTVTAPVMTVQQNTDRAIVNWNTFNVGREASVVFQQPAASSVILNRVLDSNPSQIFGNLQSNGQVFLLNPAGIFFGLGSSVDVGGLVATTHSMANKDFMAGNYRFDRNGATGKVINDGSIEAKLGGYIALLAPEVQNSGVLLAKSGTIALASGETVTMNVNPANSKVDLLVTPSTIESLIENKKIIKAPDGNVIVSAQAYNTMTSGVIRNSGEVVATGISKSGGRIVLGASNEIANSGRIDA